jgi:hypothetical protein
MAWRRLQVVATGAVIEGPLIYGGALLKASAGGIADVQLVDGNLGSQEPLDDFRCPASEHDIHVYDTGLYVMRGLFVTIGANVGWFEVLYDLDIPEATGGPREGP